MPDVIEKMAAFGAVPVGGPAADLAKLNAADFQRLGKVIQELGIVAE